MSIVGEPSVSQPATPKKDVWDKLAILLPFVSGLLIAAVGGYFTYNYNRQQTRIAELQTMESYITQLTGPEEARRLARQVISKFGSPVMQLALVEISRDKNLGQQQQELAVAVFTAAAAPVFDNTNIDGVMTGAMSPEVTFSQPHLIASVYTYHWNDGRGATPGTLSLKRDDDKTFGPWTAVATSGYQGAPNVNWESTPGVIVPAGRYTVIDSSPKTWSRNARSGDRGFVRIKATPTN